MTDPLRQRVRQQFGQNPQGYVASPTHADGEDLARLLTLLQPQPDWRILDVATGGGHTARVLSPSVAQVIAADLTMPMLLSARDHFRSHGLENLICHLLDAQTLPYRSSSLNAVTCRVAAHHFPDPACFVQECGRVVRTGGKIAIVDQIVPRQRKTARFINAFDRLRDPGHAWAYSLPRWEGFFQAAGLAVDHRESFAQRHDLFAWAERMRCSPSVVTRLRAMLIQAPPEAAEWFQAELTAGGGGSFLIHQAIIIGHKTGETPFDS